MTGDVKIGDGLTAFASLNYQYRKTLNFPTNGYGGLGANFNQWWQRQLDMDRHVYDTRKASSRRAYFQCVLASKRIASKGLSLIHI